MRWTVCGWLFLTGVSISLAGQTDLFEALRADDQAAVASMLRSGADANSRNRQGATALMQAALHSSPTVLKLLLDHGADLNANNPLGATALMWAAGDPEKVKILLEHQPLKRGPRPKR